MKMNERTGIGENSESGPMRAYSINLNDKRRGPVKYYFEDLEEGEVFISAGRTVTEADIVNFAGLSGDYNPLHVDAEFAKSSIFGERVAHGLLGMIIASGLFTRTELALGMRETGLAFLGIRDWQFKGPIKIGDTVHLEAEIVNKRETSHSERGVITIRRKLVNQRGEVIQEGETGMLIHRRPA